MNRKLVGIGILLVVVFGLGFGSRLLEKHARVAASTVEAPRFEVDPLWPKPLPNHWIIGAAVGVSVDAQDHIWIVHRTNSFEPMEIYASEKPPASECCISAPPVLEFDEAGNLLASWGGPGEGYDWPESNHGITVDYKGNVWIGGNSRGRDTKSYHDNMVLKFTQSGKFLMQIGHPAKSKGSNDIENLKGPAKLFVDPVADELYVADGYGNHRVIVYDAETGKYKRHWGAYGHKPDDTDLGPYNPDAPPAQQFRNPVHCAEIANDGLLYVCDRPNDRIQVFRKDGTFVKEAFVATRTLGDGSVWDIAFSKDPVQKYIFLADGSNEKIYVMRRDTLEIVTSFGDGGRQPGQFYAVHSIAADSKGNLFTTETYRGQRVQKFVYKGLAPVTRKDQGTVWPKAGN
jgi:DNA-binding beta-propeller fold protein YncE